MLPQADITLYIPQIFWLIIAFGALYFVISKFIVPKMEDILLTRQKIIDDDLNYAEALTGEIAKLKASYEESLITLYGKAENLKQNSLNQFNAFYEDQKINIQQELSELEKVSLKEIAQNTQAFIANQEESILELAQFIIKKMINKEPNMKILKKSYKEISL